jgi:hypothetical protein
MAEGGVDEPVVDVARDLRGRLHKADPGLVATRPLRLCAWAHRRCSKRPSWPRTSSSREITSRTRSGLVKVTLAIPATSMVCTDSSTIYARRHVTAAPDDRRTIRHCRFPSPFETSRTRKPSLDTTTSNPTSTSVRSGRAAGTPTWWTCSANVRYAALGRNTTVEPKPQR